MKKILFVLLTIFLVLSPFLVTASTNDSQSEDVHLEEVGTVSSKDEVVYATLSATGDRQEVYIVNALDVEKSGKIVDYGTYASLKNLTDLSDIQQNENKVEITAPAGKFYYQGNTNDMSLPWDISISYFINGEELSPEELVGKEGKVEIRIETSTNEKGDQAFAENYLLQISLPFDADVFSNIKADDGMIASVGKDKQVTFTVMPGQEETFTVEGDVVDFELDGIDITGVPSSMSIDTPDVGEMTDEMKTLSEAIADINDGVVDFESGISELNVGASDLEEGSTQYKNGMTNLDGSSAELVDGSKEIEKALEGMSNSFDEADELDMGDMNEVAAGLTEISSGLDEISGGFTELKEGYHEAYGALSEAIDNIPADVTEEEILKLYASGADEKVLGKLLETYEAALTAKGIHSSEELQMVFTAVVPSLNMSIESLTQMSTNIEFMANELSSALEDNDIADGITQLQEGIAMLSSEYKNFHSGLVDYTEGVSQLSNTYEDLHNGIVELSKGTNLFVSGVGELHDGTTALHEATSDLPDQMTEEIDQMIADYDKSDFQAVSFVSSQNENVNSVQFVLKTESIKHEEVKKVEEPKEKKKGFWERLIDLFR